MVDAGRYGTAARRDAADALAAAEHGRMSRWPVTPHGMVRAGGGT
ncbi:hypothetical protein WDH52_06625 [Streptomyces sp. TRM70308]